MVGHSLGQSEKGVDLWPRRKVREEKLCCGWADFSRARFGLVNQKWAVA